MYQYIYFAFTGYVVSLVVMQKKIFQNVEELDCDFTIEKVKKAISALKRDKRCGIDNLIPEVFIESSESIAPMLCTLLK